LEAKVGCVLLGFKVYPREHQGNLGILAVMPQLQLANRSIEMIASFAATDILANMERAARGITSESRGSYNSQPNSRGASHD
jgi:hypothetical protein